MLAIEANPAAFNPDAARRFAAGSVVATDGSATLPERGRPGLEEGTRELAAMRPSPFVCRAETDGGRIWIARVLHGARHRGPGGTL